MKLLSALGMLVALGTSAPDGLAKDEPLTDDKVVVKTEGAHRLLLPKDWPVEHKDGQLSPIPLEEYLSMKFGQVKEKFSEEDERIAELTRRLEQLEQDQTAVQKRLRMIEQRLAEQEVPHGDTTQKP